MYKKKHLELFILIINQHFSELLDKDASFSVHHRNTPTLATEIYKHIHGLSAAVMGEVFKINRTLSYNLRRQNVFSSRVRKTVIYGTKTIFFLAPEVWALVPEKMKESSFMEAFKSKIRKCKPNCSCRLSKTYLQHVGFL